MRALPARHTVGAPFWFYLAARLRPVVYIRLAAVVIFLSYLFVFISMYFTELLGIALITSGVCNLVANPTLSFGFLGDDEVEVSEVRQRPQRAAMQQHQHCHLCHTAARRCAVRLTAAPCVRSPSQVGRRMLTVSETTKFVLLAIGMLLAGVAHTAVPHLIVTGVLTLLSGALMAWFCHPMSLSKAYKHLALTFSGQWELLKHLRCVGGSGTCSGMCACAPAAVPRTDVLHLRHPAAAPPSLRAAASGCRWSRRRATRWA